MFDEADVGYAIPDAKCQDPSPHSLFLNND